MSRNNFLRGGSVLALVLSCGLAAPAIAAEAADAPHTIDELVVTAQKRTQNLQDVAIVVTAVNAQQLQDAGVRDIKDLTILTPGLTVTTTSSAAITSARIRGIGTVGDNVGLESSVGVVIDGVYRPRNGVAFGDLGELDRIEILKGPQGTLFGKNTSAGVINIMTKRPSFSFDAQSEATASNFNGFGASTSVTGPLAGDALAGRLYVAARARDGYYNRVGSDTNNQDFYTGRGQLLWQINPDADVNFAIDYTKRDEQCCGAVQIFNGATAAITTGLSPGGIANPVDPRAYNDYGTVKDDKEIEDKGASAELNWKTPWLGGANFTSITAVREWEQRGGGDTDWTAASILVTPPLDSANPGFTRFRQFSQEFRLAGATEKLNWVAGAFFTAEDLTLHVRTVTYGTQFEPFLSALISNQLPLFTGKATPDGTTFVAGQGQNDTYKQKERGQALFFNTNYKLTEQLELTLGARYTWEEKNLSTVWNNTDGGIGCATTLARGAALAGRVPATLVQAGGQLAAGPYQLICSTAANPRFGALGTNAQHLEEDAGTGTVKLSYRFTPEVLTYASYARGYKAGGFNLDRIAPGTQSVAGQASAPVLDTSFKPELVDSYELGIKNTLLNRSLLLNATVFYQSYTDFQLNAFNGLVFTVASVPEVISRGVDADFVWFTPIEGLTASGGVTYAETYYDESTPLTLGARFAGSRLSLAPLWSVSAAGSYQHDIGEALVGKVALNGKYVSSYNTGSDLNPIKNQEGFFLLNARIGIGSKDKRWELEAFAQNLTDKFYYQVAFDAPFQPGSFDAFLGMPRTYGATLRLRY